MSGNSEAASLYFWLKPVSKNKMIYFLKNLLILEFTISLIGLILESVLKFNKNWVLYHLFQGLFYVILCQNNK
jgi:hypothetical protein